MPRLPAATRHDGMTRNRRGRSGLKPPAIPSGLWRNFGDASIFETVWAIRRPGLRRR